LKRRLHIADRGLEAITLTIGPVQDRLPVYLAPIGPLSEIAITPIVYTCPDEDVERARDALRPIAALP
jgi:hypothetical protein